MPNTLVIQSSVIVKHEYLIKKVNVNDNYQKINFTLFLVQTKLRKKANVKPE